MHAYITLFCVQLLHFLCDFYHTFTEWLSPCAAAQIIRLMRFNRFWRSYCPLFKFTHESFCVHSNTSRVIFTILSQNECQQVPQCILSGFCVSIVFEGVIALCLNLHIKASVCNSSYFSHAIFTKLSENDFRQVSLYIMSGFAFRLFLKELLPFV